jgi:hypothetical protein
MSYFHSFQMCKIKLFLLCYDGWEHCLFVSLLYWIVYIGVILRAISHKACTFSNENFFCNKMCKLNVKSRAKIASVNAASGSFLKNPCIHHGSTLWNYFPMNYEHLYCASLYVLDKVFLFSCKARSLSKNGAPERCFSWVSSRLTHKHMTSLENFAQGNSF